MRQRDDGVVLFSDLTQSTDRSESWPQPRYETWKGRGLDIIAAWSRAFGGEEIARHGDGLYVIFPTADAAVMAAALAEVHFGGLRITGVQDNVYIVPTSIDVGPVRVDFGGKPEGPVLNRVAKINQRLKDAVLADPGKGCSYATPDVFGRCERTRKFLLVEPFGQFDLAGEPRVGAEVFVRERSRVTVKLIESAAFVIEYAESMSGDAFPRRRTDGSQE
jgi:hypothetical protein